ncbi:hypothetical protein EGT07_22460 [Herbaspirillum sp. HC18]|nr:hypothetical protein EGT07_22460 [Herbaspirillum sp. HC18]
MHSCEIKSLFACVVGAVALAGCASSRPPAMAQNVQSGKVVSVESAMASDQASSGSLSSGSGATGTMASGGPAIVTVQFNDGTQRRYTIEQRSSPKPIATGDPVTVITDPDRVTITH